MQGTGTGSSNTMNFIIRNILKSAKMVHGRVFESTYRESTVESQVISLDLLRCCGLSAAGQLVLCNRLWTSVVRELLPKAPACSLATTHVSNCYWWISLELGMIHFFSEKS